MPCRLAPVRKNNCSIFFQVFTAPVTWRKASATRSGPSISFSSLLCAFFYAVFLAACWSLPLPDSSPPLPALPFQARGKIYEIQCIYYIINKNIKKGLTGRPTRAACLQGSPRGERAIQAPPAKGEQPKGTQENRPSVLFKNALCETLQRLLDPEYTMERAVGTAFSGQPCPGSNPAVMPARL